MSIIIEAIKTITYEQPLNEPMRICLRLEHLFNQISQHIQSTATESSHQTVNALVRILDVINRPDLKSKLTQTLTQHATTLAQLEQFPQVDPSRLKNILKKLDDLISSFHQQKNRVGERLRNNEFLNQIRLRQGNPGGACAYSTPAYSLWLTKTADERCHDLEIWASEFSELRQMIELILYLTRNSNPAQSASATNGFYHQTLNPSLPSDIIRVTVSTEHGVFPEFSVGRHRLSIRFLVPNFQDNGRPCQLDTGLEFDLSCCRV
jgi:cell division protein ZapD